MLEYEQKINSSNSSYSNGPEIIRLSRVIYALNESKSINHILIHTGQNYDYELNQIFFDNFNIPKPNYFLNAAGGSASSTIGNIISSVEKYWLK